MSVLVGVIAVASLALNVVLVKELKRNKKELERTKKRTNSFASKLRFANLSRMDTEEKLTKISQELKTATIAMETAYIERDNMQYTMDMLERLTANDRGELKELRVRNSSLEQEIFKYIGEIKESKISLGKCYF